MDKPRTSPTGSRLGRIARWMGLDHNPLRRPVDRLEAWLRLAVIALMVTVVPVAAMACSQVANHVMTRQAQAQQRSDRLVTAVLTKGAPANVVDPYVPDPDVWVQARWTAPDGAFRSGQILAPAGTLAGDKVEIWVNSEGATVDPPTGHAGAVTGAILIGVTSGLLLDLFLVSLNAIAQRTLDRRRLAAWDREWGTTGPLWSRHRT
jgi:hypothetical protein